MTATTQKPRRKQEDIMDCLQTILPWEEMLLLAPAAAAAAVVVVKEATISWPSTWEAAGQISSCRCN